MEKKIQEVLKSQKDDHSELEEQSYQTFLEKAKVVLEEILSQFREPFLVSVSISQRVYSFSSCDKF